jgi:peptidylprolyl isomerase
VGSEKRERQKMARVEKIEAEEKAARRTRNKRVAIRTAVAAVVIIGGLGAYTLLAGDDGDETAAENETTTSSTPPSTMVAPPECTPSDAGLDLAEDVMTRQAPDPAPAPADTPADALQCEILFEGQGEAAAAGDTVMAMYVGKIPDGTVFDSSWTEERMEPISVALATGEVIPGWDSGLIGAKVGERRRLVIGSTYAYGEQGGGDAIPPNTPLAFEIDIVDVLTPEEAATTTTTAPAAPPASG